MFYWRTARDFIHGLLDDKPVPLVRLSEERLVAEWADPAATWPRSKLPDPGGNRHASAVATRGRRCRSVCPPVRSRKIGSPLGSRSPREGRL